MYLLRTLKVTKFILTNILYLHTVMDKSHLLLKYFIMCSVFIRNTQYVALLPNLKKTMILRKIRLFK